MKESEIDEKGRTLNWGLMQKYIEECESCNKVHKLRTQPDNHPEYYTDINIICDCDEIVHFSLPVN